MDIELKAWLFDILNAINEIESFVNQAADFSGYQKDIKTKRATERNIEIIGEAMSRILVKDNSLKLSNARKIVDTRNRIIHGYDTVSDNIMWNVITAYLPILKKEIQHLLNQ